MMLLSVIRMLAPTALHNLFMVSMVTFNIPFSILLIDVLSIPVSSANLFWVILFFFLALAICLPIYSFLFILDFFANIIKNGIYTNNNIGIYYVMLR